MTGQIGMFCARSQWINRAVMVCRTLGILLRDEGPGSDLNHSISGIYERRSKCNVKKQAGREKRESGRAEEITNDAEVYKADGRDWAAWRLGCCSEWTARKWPCPGSCNHNRPRWRAFGGTRCEGISGRPQTYRRSS